MGRSTWLRAQTFGVRAQGNAQLAGGFQRDFALGHQFHAFFLNFADLVDNLQKVDQVEFAGSLHSAWEGTRATGGSVYLIDGQAPNRPFGLRYDVGDLKIEITPSDWRDLDGTQVPYALSINDGERVFEYRYQSVDLSDKPFTWFYDQIKSPGIDAVDIERLHRNLLIAHCMGDADGMEALTAPNAVVVSGGSVFDIAKGDTARQFTNVFSRRQYSAYIDTALPRVQVDGDVGWAAVQVNAKGITPANGEQFDEHWGWVMMARKIDGQWLMAGNASNLRPKGE